MKRNFTQLNVILLLVFNLPAYSQDKGATEIPSYYPAFSWDKVPVYMHSGDSDGLTEEESVTLSRPSLEKVSV